MCVIMPHSIMKVCNDKKVKTFHVFHMWLHCTNVFNLWVLNVNVTHYGIFKGIHNLCTFTYWTNVKGVGTIMLLPFLCAHNKVQGQGERGNMVLWRYINERREGRKCDWAPWVWPSCPVCSALPLHSIIGMAGSLPQERKEGERKTHKTKI